MFRALSVSLQSSFPPPSSAALIWPASRLCVRWSLMLRGKRRFSLVARSGCQFDSEYKTKLDLAKLAHPKVADLVALQVLLLDEVSMLDKLCFEGIQQVLDIVDHNRRPDAPLSADPFGDVHLLLFGDYKQLPPASSQAPFIIIPSVVQTFEFRCLRQNRRVVQQAGREAELEIATRKQTTTTTNSGGGVRSALKTPEF